MILWDAFSDIAFLPQSGCLWCKLSDEVALKDEVHVTCVCVADETTALIHTEKLRTCRCISGMAVVTFSSAV